MNWFDVFSLWVGRVSCVVIATAAVLWGLTEIGFRAMKRTLLARRVWDNFVRFTHDATSLRQERKDIDADRMAMHRQRRIIEADALKRAATEASCRNLPVLSSWLRERADKIETAP